MSAGSVKTALDKLVKMDVIQKGEKRYELVDPFLGMCADAKVKVYQK